MNKFKSVEELKKAYKELEKEFTKKCQSLSELKKQNSNLLKQIDKLNNFRTDICVMCEYEVHYVCEYSYISDKIGDEYIFSDGNINETETLSGGRLIEMISNMLIDYDIFEFYPIENGYCFDCFSPSNGETCLKSLTFKRIGE